MVHIAYEDAEAYCEWAGRRLPTEAGWEYAAKGGLTEARFSWGDDDSSLSEKANTRKGEFPTENTEAGGYENKAPVKSYPPNDYGLYDSAGNVWEMMQDWYNTNYQEEVKGEKLQNPKGAQNPYNPNNPKILEKVIIGGSFFCNAFYCASYRPSVKMENSLDSSQEHLVFRTVASPEMLKKEKMNSLDKKNIGFMENLKLLYFAWEKLYVAGIAREILRYESANILENKLKLF